jgi:hypothetical protein
MQWEVDFTRNGMRGVAHSGDLSGENHQRQTPEDQALSLEQLHLRVTIPGMVSRTSDPAANSNVRRVQSACDFGV